jgi:predicted MFS family arabinose efflux permease
VLSLVLGPVLEAVVGVPGIFVMMLLMAVSGLLLLRFAVPDEPPRAAGSDAPSLSVLLDLLVRPSLAPLYAGMFALHFLITATFIAAPPVLVTDLGLASAGHWKVYLGVFVASLAGTIPLIMATERTKLGPALLVAAVLLAALSQAALGRWHGSLWGFLGALTLFFAAFNYLEARLPALLTLAASSTERGAALGIFATAQFLGAFAGGALGGVLLGRFGLPGVFWGGAVLGLAWAGVAGLSGRAGAFQREHA